jgi:cytochrome c5
MIKQTVIVIFTCLIITAFGAAMAADGRTTYRQTCSSCHETGAAGAPQLENKAEWKPRLAKGTDALYASILNKKCDLLKELRKDLSDDKVKAAVNYMVSQTK